MFNNNSPHIQVNSPAPFDLLFPLDDIPDSEIELALAKFRLRTGFAGNLLELIDFSDNSAHNVGLTGNFVADGDIDAVGTNVGISKVYSQVTGKPNATQSTISAMLDCKIAGVIQKNSAGVLGATRDSSTQYMETDTFTMPKNFTLIDIFSIDNATNWNGNDGGTWNVGVNGVASLYYSTSIAGLVYKNSGSTNIGTLSMVADPRKGVVAAIYYDDSNGEYTYNHESDENTGTFTANGRTATSMKLNLHRRFSGTPSKCAWHGTILLNTVNARVKVLERIRSMMGI